LHPISHAVVNTIKRVVIIVVSVLVFRNPMTSQSIAGSAIAVIGVLLYSMAKHYCPSPSPKTKTA
jgi:solute carrier family 35 protein E1